MMRMPSRIVRTSIKPYDQYIVSGLWRKGLTAAPRRLSRKTRVLQSMIDEVHSPIVKKHGTDQSTRSVPVTVSVLEEQFLRTYMIICIDIESKWP